MYRPVLAVPESNFSADMGPSTPHFDKAQPFK